jgi:hypothetical protein
VNKYSKPESVESTDENFTMNSTKPLTLLLFLALTSPPAGAAQCDQTPFPEPASKKGLQVQMVEDALALGVKHAALNVNFAQLLTTQARTNELSLMVDGRAFSFSRSYVEHLDRQIKPLSDRDVVVSLILLYYRSSDEALNRIMLHPKYDPASPNHLSAFNTTNPESSAALRASVEFLARRYSQQAQPYGRVWNYIVGNEVNSHWFWSNMGRVTMEEFADDYLRAVRVCHEAVRQHSANARVYLSLEHHWNIRYPGGDAQQAFPGKAFIDYFARRARETGEFDWHLAFHPYPEDLFDSRTWQDETALFTPDTPRITFKNLEVLPRYFKRPELLINGKSRRIILSEQGFHSPETVGGQTLQAAAYCYAYYKAAQLDGIDSFILHRHVDHGKEGGLNLGLWSRNKNSGNPAEPLARKKIYEIFKAADQPGWQEEFQFALPVIGIRNWTEILRQGD